jgi:hypothetical protein
MKRKMGNIMFLSVLVGCVLMVGCRTGGGTGGKKGQGKADASFLITESATLNAWLDEKFEVEYRELTLDSIFEQPPIADIHYEFRHVAKQSPLFSLAPSNISRREILRRIAAFYHLKMSVAEINGKPAYVLVVGTAASSEFDPNEAGGRSVPVREL